MKSVELRKLHASQIAEARKYFDEITAENREPTPEETAAFDAKMSEADQTRSKAESAERGEKLENAEADLKVSTRKSAPIPANNGPHFHFPTHTERERKEAILHWAIGTGDPKEAHRAAQFGIDVHNPNLSLRALSVGSNAAGGYSVPVELASTYTEFLKFYGKFRNFCQVLNTEKGSEFDWTTIDDTANTAETPAEGAAPVGEDNPTFGRVAFKAKKYNSQIIPVSIELLQDSIMDIERVIAQLLAKRIARKQESDFLNGAGGGSAPRGMVTAATAVTAAELASGNAVTFAKLKSLEHGCDQEYRPRARFVMHDLTMSAVEQIQDDQHRPVFLQNLTDPTKRTLFGYPIETVNMTNYIGSEGDNKALILFGDFSEYVIRDVIGSTVFSRFDDSAYRGQGQVGLMAETRGWADYVGPTNNLVSMLSYNS